MQYQRNHIILQLIASIVLIVSTFVVTPLYSRAYAQQSFPAIVKGLQTILPDEQLVHVSSDHSVTFTFPSGAFDQPAVVEYERILEGDPTFSDEPPTVPLTVHRYVSLNIRAVTAIDAAPTEPSIPVTIELRSPIDTDRAGDLTTLRIVREHGTYQSPVQATVVWDEQQQIATATFAVTAIGSYQLVASALPSPTNPLTITSDPPKSGGVTTQITRHPKTLTLQDILIATLVLIATAISIVVLVLIVRRARHKISSPQSNTSSESDSVTDLESSHG